MNRTVQPRAAGRRRPPGTPARPPFPFSVTAPPGWSEALRGDAPSLHDDLLAIVARSELWPVLDDRRRRGLASVLGEIARVSAATGAVATMLHLAAPRPALAPSPAKALVRSDPAVSSISLTWLRTAPLLADLDLARLVIEAGEPVATGLGPGLLARRPGTSAAGAERITSQIAAPVPRSIWLAVLTGTTTSSAQAPVMDDALLTVATSLRAR